MNKNLIIITIVLAILAVGIFLMSKGEGDPILDPSASITPTSSAGPSTSGPAGVPVGISTIKPECQLDGDVTFIAAGTFKSDKPNFYYQKVMDSHDIVNWTISPKGEDISVGPNRFSSLPLPSGQEFITVAFNSGQPKYKEYELSASIDYPYVVNNEVKVLNKKCSGKVRVIIDY